MATHGLANLCRVILTDVYGELAAQVVGILFDHGRQTASQIARRAKLAQSTVNRTLVALLQNRFLLNWQDAGSTTVYYYANWTQIYGVLWNGEIVAMVSKESDHDLSAEVVKNVLVYGNMKAQDYLESYNADKEQVTELVTKLMQERILSPVMDFEFHPVEDIRATMLKKELLGVKHDMKLKSDAARLAAATTASTRTLEELLESKDVANVGLLKLEDKSMLKRKRIRKEVVEGYTIDPEVVIGVNYEKYLVLARNQMLVKLVQERVGNVTAKVYENALKRITPKLHRCRMRSYIGKEFNLSTRDILRGLDPSLDIEGSIYKSVSRKRTMESISSASKRQKTDDGFVENGGDESVDEFGSDDDDDETVENGTENGNGAAHKQHSIFGVRHHLELLVDSSLPFLQKIGTDEWHVPWEELMAQVRKATFETVIRDRFGPVSFRVLRIIQEKGKVEESMLDSVALLRAADYRKSVGLLQGCGALDLQEIAKSNDRAPKKTLFLWYHNPQRAQAQLLEDLYFAMHHIYKRLFAERKENSILLAKLDREDVKNNEEEYLSEQEKVELNNLRKREEKLLAQLMRIDGLVKLFRDY